MKKVENNTIVCTVNNKVLSKLKESVLPTTQLDNIKGGIIGTEDIIQA